MVVMLLSGCASDTVSAIGDHGRVRYSVPRQLEEADTLRDLRFATGLLHVVDAHLTEPGKAAVQRPGEVSHRAIDEQHTITDGGGGGWDRVGPGHLVETMAPVNVLALAEGAAVVETHEGVRIIDRIALPFEDAASLGVHVRARGPDRGDESVDLEAPYQVEAGTVLSFTVHPLARDGAPLRGELPEPEIRTDPPLALAPYNRVTAVFEDGIVSEIGADRRGVELEYTVLPAGRVTIEFTDTQSGAEGVVEVDVSPRTEEP